MSVEIIQGDYREHMCRLWGEGRRFDLIFADPPFNLNYSYDIYEDNKSLTEYLEFTEKWLSGCDAMMEPGGSIWIAAPDEYVHRFRVLAEDQLRWTFVAHVIWRYTFGQHRKRGFTRSHAHLLHYSNGKPKTWNGDAVKVPSWRQLNGDKRAAPGGRHPDDVWDYPRICGTHRERRKHPCQMPEALLARIVRVSSNPGETIMEPFVGSGSMASVAKKLGRNYIGFELSEAYAADARVFVDSVEEDDPIQGESTTQPRSGIAGGR